MFSLFTPTKPQNLPEPLLTKYPHIIPGSLRRGMARVVVRRQRGGEDILLPRRGQLAPRDRDLLHRATAPREYTRLHRERYDQQGQLYTGKLGSYLIVII